MQNSLDKRLTSLEALHSPTTITGEHLHIKNARLWKSGRLVNDGQTVKALNPKDVEAVDWARLTNVAKSKATASEARLLGDYATS